MNLIYLFIAILATWLLYKLLIFIFKGGNYNLIPINIAKVYKTLKRKFSNKYDSKSELLFIAGMINARTYIIEGSVSPEMVYTAAEDCKNIEDETNMIAEFSKALMKKYFSIDTNVNMYDIVASVDNKGKSILKSVFKELNNSKNFPENVIRKNISGTKKHFAEFENEKNMKKRIFSQRN